MQKWPLGVFTSVDAGLGVRFEVVQELKIPTVHLHSPSPKHRTPEAAEAFCRRCQEAGITVTVVFAGFEGESYADILTVRRTVGLVPPETRQKRLAELKSMAAFARLLGVQAVGLHIGFIPESPADPIFKDLVQVTRDVCDYLKNQGQALHLETGQETAEILLEFLEAVGRDNLFVNFDPANMILYGTGEPISALRKVGRYVRSVHCKDAKWAARPGQEWGQEVPLGQGDVDFRAFLRTLDELGYRGPLTIEREIAHDPERQKRDIRAALEVLESLQAELG
jgi:sugar phosphate isomerase/epimerase